jgi:hypothetical protein
MNIYSIALFLHIAGALGFFSALAVEWTGLRQIQHAVLSDQARAGMRILAGIRRLGMTSMLLSLITGIYITVIAWRNVAWTIVALGSVILLIVVAVTLTRPRVAALETALATEKGMLSQNFHGLANHRLLDVSLKTRVAVSWGIIFLMTVKPGLGGSLLVIAIAIVSGFVFSLSTKWHERMQEGSAD